MYFNKKLNNNEIIELRPINSNFLCSTSYNSWINDTEINKYSSLCRFPVTENDKKQLLIDMENKKSIHWSIAHKETEDSRPYYIGTISLQDIDMFNRSAELTIKIGYGKYWGKGIGFASCQLILYHGFKRLNLNRMYLGTLEENKGMVRLASKIKMKYDGILREAVFSEGIFHNVLLYSIINSEYGEYYD